MSHRDPAAAAAASVARPLRIIFFPLPSPGHILPMVDIAALFASRGAVASLVLTPLAAARFAPPDSPSLRTLLLPFPSAAAASLGLPPGCETADSLPSRSLSGPFAAAVDLLAAPFCRLLRSDTPDAVVSDHLLPWTAAAAAEFGVPRYSFTGTGCFALSVDRSLLLHRPHDRSDPFLVPGLPDPILLTRSKLAEATLPGAQPKEYFDRARDADRLTAAYVVNTFPELEPGYVRHYENETEKRVFAVGPVALSGRRGAAAPEPEPEAAGMLAWLDTKAPGSVAYVCFGSLCRFPEEQVREIGLGLADSGVLFVWVVREDDAAAAAAVAEAGERGLVVRGWAAQVAALRHAAVGGFLTHCGWGAVTEAAAVGVAALTWPVFAEQFYNEELVVGVAGTGVAVGAERGYVWGEEDKGGVVVGRARVAERVRWLMTAEGAEGVRRRAREMGESARRAVAEGGSSYANVGLMMEDIRRRRRRRQQLQPGKVVDGGGGSAGEGDGNVSACS